MRVSQTTNKTTETLVYGSATPMRGKSLTCRRGSLKTQRSTTAGPGQRPEKKEEDRGRQVADLPRIGVAEPFPVPFPGASGWRVCQVADHLHMSSL